MPPALERVAGDESLPAGADVVVIGAGIIGTCAAYELARKGAKVALVEKGLVGAEQSSRNWGWCRQQGRDRHEIPLARFSLQRWEELQEETGTDLGFRRRGVLWVTKDPAELASWSRWADFARGLQVHSEVLDAAAVKALIPGTTERWIGGLHTPSDGRAEPARAALLIAAAARRHGVTLHQHCAARGIETKGGAVDAVVTEKGRIRTGAVLLAGGAWSSLFCDRHGITLPLAMVKATAFATTALPEIWAGALGTPGTCIRRREDGGYTVALRGQGTLDLTPQDLRFARAFWPTWKQRRRGLKLRIGRAFLDGLRWRRGWSLEGRSPFEEVRVLDPAPDPALVTRGLAELRGAWPAVAEANVAEAWGGSIDSTPDAVPVISAVPALPGFFLAAGFSGHGFGIGPGAGRLAADLVRGDPPVVDPQPYRHARFLEGGRLAPAGAL